MKNLDRVISKIEAELDEKDQIREVALKSSRVVVRLSGNIIRGLHKEIERTADLKQLVVRETARHAEVRQTVFAVLIREGHTIQT